MNLEDLREAVFDAADWSPLRSPDAIAKIDRHINKAYKALADDAPYQFFESQVKLATKPDFASGTGDTLELTTVDDYWVLTRSAAGTTAGGWPTNGDWDGRMIAITDPSGVVRRRRIRTMWRVGGPPDVEYLTIDKPWPNKTDTGMSYRIYSDAYYLPNDVIMVNSMRLYEDGKTWPLNVVGQREAEDAGFVDTAENTITGAPRYVFRRGYFKLPSPGAAPSATVTANVSGSFNTAEYEAPGTFRYFYTWTWGYRDAEVADMGPPTNEEGVAPRGRPPLWESAPSPTSVLVEVARDERVTLTVPPNPHLLGFGDDAGGRYQRTGWRARIYRRRESIDATTVAQTALEVSDQFYLIAEQPASDNTFDDTGVNIPDYTRRFRGSNGYQSIGFHPWPDERYEVDIRCVRRPEPLVLPTDAPCIPEGKAMDALVAKAASLVTEIDLADRAKKEAEYQAALSVMSKNYSDLQSSAVATSRRPARAARVGRGQRRWYKLITDPSSWGPFG